MQCQPNLLQIIRALHSPCCLPSRLNGEQSHFLRNQLNIIGLAMVIALSRVSNSSIMSLKSGGQMLQDTNSMPVSGGKLRKSFSSDSNPPADEPIHTINRG